MFSRFTIFVFVISLIYCKTGFSFTSDSTRFYTNSIGAAAGIPQTIAITYERMFNAKLAGQIHFGGAILIHSGGLRLRCGSHFKGFHPYLFAGVTFIHIYGQEYGDPHGTSGYFWMGPSLRRWILYAEVSGLLGGNDERGLGEDWRFPLDPAISGGVMFRF